MNASSGAMSSCHYTGLASGFRVLGSSPGDHLTGERDGLPGRRRVDDDDTTPTRPLGLLILENLWSPDVAGLPDGPAGAARCRALDTALTGRAPSGRSGRGPWRGTDEKGKRGPVLQKIAKNLSAEGIIQ